jgi:rifampicin phosphotransferase
MIYSLTQLPAEAADAAGGKARVLARLSQAGYPVPVGFVITAGALNGGAPEQAVWAAVQQQAAALRRNGSEPLLAVRSSALSEDSAAASYAGEFETVLNVQGERALREAIETVYASRDSERVAAYSAAQGARASGAGQGMAVLVQEMAPAELAGVLFTADPLSGSRARMAGSFVHGLGEQLVSGEADGEAFTLGAADGSYEGPEALRPYARQLFRLGQRLVDDLGGPQDIEWAVAGGKVWLLQARPITTLQPYDARTGVWNDSRRGDFFWSNSNFGEALPGVMTPLTWSLIRIYAEATFENPMPGDVPLMGNIGGRLYANLSLFASFLGALGFSRERISREAQEFFGGLPAEEELPVVPVRRLVVLRRFLPFAVRAMWRKRRNLRALPAFTAALPAQTAALRADIGAAETGPQLAALWVERYQPLLERTYQMMAAGTSRYENAYRPLRRHLAGQVGDEDANLLLSGVSAGGDELASLGPLLGLWRVSQGELSRNAYLAQNGHRGVHELELSWPRPAEDPAWLDKQLATAGESDVPTLLARREAQKAAAWARYEARFPRQAARMERRLAVAAAAARGREAIRSETTRLVGAARAFALRAGELLGMDDDVFFLSLEELLAALRGEISDFSKRQPKSDVLRRREAHERLSALPPYPPLINGRFDPLAWGADPARQTAGYDARAAADDGAATATVRGLPASVGVVEGVVRRLESAAEGQRLQPGEILVAATTNVGWTPLFPRAAAVVTDVGAPLSHAAIVARELGIPAVVGTGNATSRLRDGDRVRVDGTRGVVEVLGS